MHNCARNLLCECSMILFMNDNNWEREGQKISHAGMIYRVRYKARLERCPTCNASCLSAYGFNKSKYHDVPIGHQPTILRLIVPRFLCANCQRTVSQTPDGLSKTHRITEKCHEFILANRYKCP